MLEHRNSILAPKPLENRYHQMSFLLLYRSVVRWDCCDSSSVVEHQMMTKVLIAIVTLMVLAVGSP